MSQYSEWQQERAHEGSCCNCGTPGLVATYLRSPRSSLAHFGPMELCYICAFTPGANAQEYPEQHPEHSRIVGPILGAISMMLQELKPRKKPRQPRVPKLLHPNYSDPTPRRRKK